VSGRRLIRATIAALLAAATLVPGLASARRDDKVAELFRPSNGTTVADAVHGLNVDFSCPVYHQYTFDDVVTGPTEGYHVILSTSNVVDANRLLVPEGRVDVRDAVTNDDLFEHCGAAHDDADDGLAPTEPGTYYWQVYRDCATYVCTGGVEVTDVWSVTVKRTVCSVNRAELKKVRAELKVARSALARRRTAGRRARVSRLTARVTTLHQRLRVVHGCNP
jgi:hypothetical protein